MDNCEFILLIMNCHKYRDKAIQQKNGWLKNIPSNITFFHVIGDKNLCSSNKFLFNYDENILYVNTNDDYNSLPSKVIHSFEAVNETFNYKYILKTDDDQILVKNNFFDTLTNILNSKEYHYGGFSLDVPRHISKYYLIHNCLPENLILEATKYCNGRFYFLKNDAIKNLLIKKEDICKRFIEDHAIGYYLDSKYKSNLLHINTTSIFKG